MTKTITLKISETTEQYLKEIDCGLYNVTPTHPKLKSFIGDVCLKLNSNLPRYKRSDNIGGTCLKGYITTTYDNLLNKLPKPLEIYDDYKCDVEWGLEFSDGTKATIYNYKNGRNYLGDKGKDKEDITQWNIGGNSHKAVEYVSEILGVNGEEFKI